VGRLWLHDFAPGFCCRLSEIRFLLSAFSFRLSRFPFPVPPHPSKTNSKTPDIPPHSSKQKRIFCEPSDWDRSILAGYLPDFASSNLTGSRCRTATRSHLPSAIYCLALFLTPLRRYVAISHKSLI
jgi:hypothetical protein